MRLCGDLSVIQPVKTRMTSYYLLWAETISVRRRNAGLAKLPQMHTCTTRSVPCFRPHIQIARLIQIFVCTDFEANGNNNRNLRFDMVLGDHRQFSRICCPDAALVHCSLVEADEQLILSQQVGDSCQ